MKRIFELDYVARSARRPLNYFVSIMPTTGCDQDRKRACSRLVGHLGQALRRHGHPHLGMTVYEKSTGVDLHAHHLVHVPVGESAVLQWLRGRPEVHVRRAVWTDPAYVTKERLPLPPEREARVSHRRRKGSRISGTRWSATRALRDLAAAEKTR